MNTDLFQRIVKLNRHYRNIQGNPCLPNFEDFKDYSVNFEDEIEELQEALDKEDFDGVRDALCDLVVYVFGGFYKLGVDANDDINTVVDSLYSRFIKNEQDLQDSLDYYYRKGIKDVSVEGEFPMKVIRSMQNYPDAPKGKVLKSVHYKQPKLTKYESD